MRTCVYPGTFDPVTKGHLDIIERASKQFDHVVVAVLRNSSKTPLFSVEERVNILEEVLKDQPNISVQTFEGLSVEFVRKCGAQTIIRGLRATTDFEYEMQMAHMNHELDGEIDTVFFITSLKYAYLSSSIVREVASYGGDVSRLVTPYVEERLREKFFPAGKDT